MIGVNGGNANGDGVRVVQIGVGGFGQRWASLLQMSEAATLVAIVEPNETARAWAGCHLGLEPRDCLASLDEALARDDWEAAIVVTPPSTHHAIASAALRAGKHVLVEKPLATTLEDARDLVEIARTTAKILMVSLNYRFRRPARTVQGLISSGTIGELLAVKVACRRDTRHTFPPGDFRFDMHHPFILDMAIHHVDLLRAVSGRNIETVFARSWRVPDSPYLHDPAMIAVLTLAGGATVSYEGDWAAHGRETSWNGEWELIGEGGRILWQRGSDDPSDDVISLQLWGGEPQVIEPLPMSEEDQAGTLRAFVDSLATGLSPETSGADNIHSLAVVFACVESIEQCRAIDVAI